MAGEADRSPLSTLSRFVRKQTSAIIRSWERRTSEELGNQLTELALRGDLPLLLDELADWLASGTSAESSRLGDDALTHALPRLAAGLPPRQLFREYRLLRQTIIEEVLAAEAAEQLRNTTSGSFAQFSLVDDLARLNAGLDVVLSRAIDQLFEVRAHRAAEAMLESETRYRTLFESMIEGFCVVEVLFEEERPIDYRFLEVNPAFESHTGMQNARGRRMREFVPAHEERWFEIYGRVAKTGEPARFENVARGLGRIFEVRAFRVGAPELHHVAVLF
jgi:PAS domain S-box-containing protein